MNSFMPAMLVKLTGGTYINPAHISHAKIEKYSIEIHTLDTDCITINDDDPAYSEALELLDSLSLPTAAEMAEEDIPLNGRSLN